jgi:hypothetical protein
MVILRTPCYASSRHAFTGAHEEEKLAAVGQNSNINSYCDEKFEDDININP